MSTLTRAFRTAGQTFFGTLAGVTVTLDASFAQEVSVAGIGAIIAAGLAYFMNLPEEEV